MPVLLFILFFALCSFAENNASDSLVQALPTGKNIPLPKQSAYTGRGFAVGLGGGVYNPTEDCDCMGVWQGQLEYFYAERVSLSLDVRFFGGDLDSDVMIMYQRYRLNLRLHTAWQKFSVFLEPVLGFENTSISEFRNEIKNHGKKPEAGDSLGLDSLGVNNPCERIFTLDGFSVGAGGGFGVNLGRLWGITGGALFEYNFAKAMQLSLIPGIAFNLREVWPWAKNNLLSSWISFEFGVQRYFNKGIGEWSNYGLIGIQFGI